MEKKGIAVAGNMIVDVLYPVERTPKPGTTEGMRSATEVMQLYDALR